MSIIILLLMEKKFRYDYFCVSLCCRFEPSTKQVRGAINKSSADKWKKTIPSNMQTKIWNKCPMLHKLGYKQ